MLCLVFVCYSVSFQFFFPFKFASFHVILSFAFSFCLFHLFQIFFITVFTLILLHFLSLFCFPFDIGKFHCLLSFLRNVKCHTLMVMMTPSPRSNPLLLPLPQSYPQEPKDPIHIMNIGISMEEEKSDGDFSEQFAVFCAGKKKEFKDAGIRRITMVVFYRQQFPRYFTYRYEDEWS